MPRVFLLLLAASSAMPATSFACETPVWQYTMLYWEREPYLVCFLHEGAPDPADAAVNARFVTAADADGARPNVAFTDIDLSDETLALPWYLREAHELNADRPLPYHVIVSPKGTLVFTGRLTEADADALLGSPARQELCEQLSSEAQGVLVVLSSSDAEATRSATEAVEEAISAAGAFGTPARMVAVDRDAPEEAWLVRMLLLIEPDLPGIDAPMVFGVFGRGHFMPPYIGAGITPRNMADLIAFINGPCTCEIKAQSQGADLLTTFDFEANLGAFEPDGVQPEGFREMTVDELLGGLRTGGNE